MFYIWNFLTDPSLTDKSSYFQAYISHYSKENYFQNLKFAISSNSKVILLNHLFFFQVVQVNQSKLGTICLSTQWKVRINPIVFLLLNFFRKILTFWTLYVYFAEHLFNLKFAVKDLERSAKKCEKDEKLEIAKTKKAIQKGNTEVRRHIQELILYGILLSDPGL